MTVGDQPGLDWTVVLRRRPVRIVAGRPDGGYTDAFEIVCCDCGDHPDMDYRDVSPELQRIRGPYPVAAGVVAYEEHIGLHRTRSLHPAGRPAHSGVRVTAITLFTLTMAALMIPVVRSWRKTFPPDTVPQRSMLALSLPAKLALSPVCQRKSAAWCYGDRATWSG